MKGKTTMVLSPRRGRVLAAAAALVVGSLILAGCSAKPADTGPVTLTVQIQDGYQAMMKVLEAEFQKTHPKVSFREVIITGDQKNGTNTQVVGGSNPPDLAIVPTNSPTFSPLVKNGKLAPLDDVFANQKLEDRYGAAAAGTMKYKGTPYVAVIGRVYYDIVFYNKDIFDKAGITVNDHRFSTNEELYSAVNKLRAAGTQPLALGGKDAYLYAFLLDGVLASAASDEQYANLISSFNPEVNVTTKLTDPPFVDSVTQLKEWADKGVFRDGYQGQTDANAQADFTAGKVAMYLSLSAIASTLTKAKVNDSWLLLPGTPNGAKSRMLSYEGDAIAIPAAGKNIPLAKEFLELWLTDNMQANAVSNTGLALPAVNTVQVSSLTGLDPLVSEMIADVATNGAPAGYDATVPGSYGITPIGVNVGRMFAGDIGPKDVADLQQKGLETIRAAG